MKLLKRSNFIFELLLLVCLCSCQDQSNEEENKPNIVIINVDDLGYGDVGVYGATKVSSPNIDKLASQGRMLTDFHSASAVPDMHC